MAAEREKVAKKKQKQNQIEKKTTQNLITETGLRPLLPFLETQ